MGRPIFFALDKTNKMKKKSPKVMKKSQNIAKNLENNHNPTGY